MFRKFYKAIKNVLRIPRSYFNSISFKINDRKVDFMIIGAQKCGTTALHSFLSVHPKLVGSKPKELNFFNFNNKFYKGFDFYHRHFDFSIYPKLYFDASPSYLQDYNSIAAKRIFKYNPETRLIILVRNPIERAFSAFQMYKRFWDKNPDWFQKWRLDSVDYIQRSADDLLSFDNYINKEFNYINKDVLIDAPVLNHGIYFDSLKEYLKYFKREQILIVENEKMKIDLYNTLDMILKFLGICGKNTWSFDSNSNIFAGKYSESISKSAVNKLTAYYREKNEEFFKLAGKKYKW